MSTILSSSFFPLGKASFFSQTSFPVFNSITANLPSSDPVMTSPFAITGVLVPLSDKAGTPRS